MPLTAISRSWSIAITASCLAISAFALLRPAVARAAEAPVCKLQALIELPVTMMDTRPTVTAEVNGKPGRFLVDSGAFFSVLSPAAAARFGVTYDSRLDMDIAGVGGFADARWAHAPQFGLAGLSFKNVDFLVASGLDNGLDGLIGENVLGAHDAEYDLANGVVRLFSPENCGSKDLAYWAKGQAGVLPLLAEDNTRERHIYAEGSVNGNRIRVMFDTGAPRSSLTLRAAARAGVMPQTAGAVYAGRSGGIGAALFDVWVAPFDSFKLDNEEIQHVRMRIADMASGDADMLLGADFFLSHRIYVSRAQRRIYFTYNGGPVFRLDTPTVNAAAVPNTSPGKLVGAAAAAQTAPANMNLPSDAAGFARRGAAFMSRRDFAHAIEDFSRAADLDPANPQPLYDRGMARIDNRQPLLAMSDFDQALKLKPGDARALMARASLYNAAGDKARARADLEAAAHGGAASDPDIGLDLGDYFDQFGFYDEAITAYDRWIAANPRLDKTLAINRRCEASADAKVDLGKALADCNAAVRLDPRNIRALSNRGLVHFMRGEFDPAIADFDAILRVQPKAAIALYGRGAARVKKGLEAAGEADIAAATVLSPKIADEAGQRGLAP